MTREAAERIKYVLQSAGWQDIQDMIDAEIKENRDELLEMMAKRPDQLTGKTAIKYAARMRAYEDLKDQILGSQRILAPQPQRAGSR